MIAQGLYDPTADPLDLSAAPEGAVVDPQAWSNQRRDDAEQPERLAAIVWRMKLREEAEWVAYQEAERQREKEFAKRAAESYEERRERDLEYFAEADRMEAERVATNKARQLLVAFGDDAQDIISLITASRKPDFVLDFRMCWTKEACWQCLRNLRDLLGDMTTLKRLDGMMKVRIKQLSKNT